MNKLLTFLLCLSHLTLSAQWTSLNTGVSDDLLTVEAVDANTVYAAGNNRLIKSTNGGTDWVNIPLMSTTNQPILNLTINDLHFFDALVGIAVGAQTPAIKIILRTVDGGAHWETVESTTTTVDFPFAYTRVHFVNNNIGWAAGTYSSLSRTTNGGLSWTTLNNTGLRVTHDVRFLDQLNGLICGEGYGNTQLLGKSSDGGITWSPLLNGGGPILTSLAYPSAMVGYFAANDGNIVRMNNGADLSSTSDISMVDHAPVRRMHFLNENSGYALTDYTVRKTMDGGLFWEQVQLPVLFGQELNDFDFLPNGLSGFAVGKGGKAFKTLNGGAPLEPMASFFTTPGSNYEVCTDSIYRFNNPAPAATYTSQWYLDNQLISTQNDVDIVFPDPDVTYTVQLVITGANGASQYSQMFKTYPDLSVSIGEMAWIYSPPICAGNTVSFQINSPTPGATYTAYVDNVPFSTQYAFNSDKLEFYTPALMQAAVIRVEGTVSNPCYSLSVSDTLQVQVYPYPNQNSGVETSTPIVCIYDSATVTIHNSELGAFYEFTGGFTAAQPIEGNGGDLTFQTPGLFQSGDYQIIANRWFCSWPLAQTVNIQVDAFFSHLDTANNYGMVGIAINISNQSPGLASVQWDFGPQATPPAASLFEPSVTFSQSGAFPFTYHYESQGACIGEVAATFDIYDQGAPLTGMECPPNNLQGLSWISPVESPYLLASRVDKLGNLISTGSSLKQVAWYYTMNMFLQKNKPTGELLWQKRIDPVGTGQGSDYRSTFGTGLATDPDGNIFLCGTYAADQVNIFGKNFAPSFPGNKYLPQGFLMKLGSGGNVLWSISIQSGNDFEHCAPSSLLYSSFDQQVHLIVHGPSWQAKLPDGSIVFSPNSNTAGWLLVFDTNGQYLDAEPLGDIPVAQLMGFFHTPLHTTSSATGTYTSPRLREGPNGTLYVAGQVVNLPSIQFGNEEAVAASFGQDFQQRNHFIAVFDRGSQAWKHAFMTHRIGTYTGSTDAIAPAFQVDEAGNAWIGFGLVQPETSGPELLPSVCAIGQGPTEFEPNRGYLAQFSQNGHLNWVSRASNLFFHELLQQDNGGMFALAGFNRATGFHTPNNDYTGTIGKGNKDLLLAEFSGTGDVKGLRALGTTEWDQPIALAADKMSGNLYCVMAPNLNFALQSTNNQPFALHIYPPTGACPVVGTQEASTWDVTMQVIPNPVVCGATFKLRCTLPEAGETQLQLVDLLGRNIWTSHFGHLPAGDQTLSLDFAGVTLAPGVYFLGLQMPASKGQKQVIFVDEP